MKLNNYKIKIKHLNFEPLSKKSDYSYNDIMYLYYTIQFKSKECKFSISGGDCGIKLLKFIQEIKLLIQDKYPYAQFDGCRVSILDNSSLLDEATGDSSFKAIKKVYDGTTYYSLIFKNPNGKALVLDSLKEDEVKSFISFVENKIEEILKFQSKVDDIILTIGKDNYEYDLHNIVVDGVISDKPREEIINIYNKLLPHKDSVYSIINSVQADELDVPYEAYEKLYNIVSGGSDSKEEIVKLLKYGRQKSHKSLE